jgi:ubiquinone/menaquinone biosynthesis C-methylase UbiE
VRDLIENRTRVGFLSKLRLAVIMVRDNGLLWPSLMGLYYVASAIAESSYARAASLRDKNNLSGLNSSFANKYIWENWNWSGRGEEWTISPEWKNSVVRIFMDKYFDNRSVILEIGPGAGRWTEYLLKKCDHMFAVDISETSIRECKRRFSSYPNATFEVGNGHDLSSISTGSVDGVWSFDVFVHINKPQFKSYVVELARVLKPGGVGLIQHGSMGGATGGWRSDIRNTDVNEFLQSNELIMESQVQNWDDNGIKFEAGLYQDTITIFHKPLRKD